MSSARFPREREFLSAKELEFYRLISNLPRGHRLCGYRWKDFVQLSGNQLEQFLEEAGVTHAGAFRRIHNNIVSIFAQNNDSFRRNPHREYSRDQGRHQPHGFADNYHRNNHQAVPPPHNHDATYFHDQGQHQPYSLPPPRPPTPAAYNRNAPYFQEEEQGRYQAHSFRGNRHNVPPPPRPRSPPPVSRSPRPQQPPQATYNRNAPYFHDQRQHQPLVRAPRRSYENLEDYEDYEQRNNGYNPDGRGRGRGRGRGGRGHDVRGSGRSRGRGRNNGRGGGLGRRRPYERHRPYDSFGSRRSHEESQQAELRQEIQEIQQLKQQLKQQQQQQAELRQQQAERQQQQQQAELRQQEIQQLKQQVERQQQQQQAELRQQQAELRQQQAERQQQQQQAELVRQQQQLETLQRQQLQTSFFTGYNLAHSAAPQPQQLQGGALPLLLQNALLTQQNAILRCFQAAQLQQQSIKPPMKLGDDCFVTILAFLPLDQLVFLRSLSKDTKAKVDEMVSKRAPQQPPTLELDLTYRVGCRRAEANGIRIRQGWTEDLQDKESVIEHAIQWGELTCCEPREVERARDCLRRSGIASMQCRNRYEYSREIEWNDALEVSAALKQVVKYFQRIEREVWRISGFYAFNCIWNTQTENNGLVRNVVLAKETILSLLLTNSSNTVGFSKIESEDEGWGCDQDDKKSHIDLVIRLDNEMEIYLDTSFYDWFIGMGPH